MGKIRPLFTASASLITYSAKKTRKYMEKEKLSIKKYLQLFNWASVHANLIQPLGDFEKSVKTRELEAEAYGKLIDQMKSEGHRWGETKIVGRRKLILYSKRFEAARRGQGDAYSEIVALIDAEINTSKAEQTPDQEAYYLGLKADALGKKAAALETDTSVDMGRSTIGVYREQVETQEKRVQMLESLSNALKLAPAREKLAAMQEVLADRCEKYGIK
ncbi:MAG: hypothetical protein NTX79_02770 [Candidatus Micrarchaeota archaeon]|nr:hypothetical protein [Candidatus Micrarchaeota archaeon]